MFQVMARLQQLILGLFSILRSRVSLTMENVLLRQQLISLKMKNPRIRLEKCDRVLWVLARMALSQWKKFLVLVRPETVIRWHRESFHYFWRRKSQQPMDLERMLRKREITRLIQLMAAQNPAWGAPRVHGELRMLGFSVSERTVSRIIRRVRGRKNESTGKSSWYAFIRNHRPAMAAMDFFVVYTMFFKPLYCFFVISHADRRVLLFDATFHPSAEWVKDKLSSLLANTNELRYLICDRDSFFSPIVKAVVESFSIELVRTSYQSPWQNGIAERFIGSVRRELLDHVIVYSHNHVMRLMDEYLDYYHHDRTHYALNKDSPIPRQIEKKPSPRARLVSAPRVGGLHHRYSWRDAA